MFVFVSLFLLSESSPPYAEEDGYSECSVELEFLFEAGVSALPDGIKS